MPLWSFTPPRVLWAAIPCGRGPAGHQPEGGAPQGRRAAELYPGAQRGAGAGLCLSAGRDHPLADAAGGMPPGAAGCWRFGGRSLFFTSADAAAFCSYVLPELGNRVNIVDPDRLLLNQIPLEPVVQFYLDADRTASVIEAYPGVFCTGRIRSRPRSSRLRQDLLRDARTREPGKAAAGNLSGTR